MVKDDPLPLIVTGTSGRVLRYSQMNRKAYTKSLERGKLWHVHGETGRVLPLDIPGTMLSLHADEGWFNAVVSEEEPRAIREKSVAETAGTGAGILEDLARVIARRREEMPEGSYTTHLFASGADKIRKKLGEEAVELILATDPADITLEAADLVYHLLVYLEYVGVSLNDVLGELRRRR